MVVIRRYYGRNLRTAVGASGAPYGYTLTTWTTGAVLVHARGLPTTVQAFLFMVGAVLGFALVGIAAFGGHRARFREEPRKSALWGNFHIFSVGSSIGAASLVAHLIDNVVVWPATAFVATTIYLLVLGVEFAAADERDPER